MENEQLFLINAASSILSTQGRLAEALPGLRRVLRERKDARNWRYTALQATYLVYVELLIGEVATALATAQQGVAHADQCGDLDAIVVARVAHAEALTTAGRCEEAVQLFADCERRQKNAGTYGAFLYSLQGYLYCSALISRGDYVAAMDRAKKTIVIARRNNRLLDIGLDTLTIGRARLGLALVGATKARWSGNRRDDTGIARTRLDEAVEALRGSGDLTYVVRGLLARATFHRSVGDRGWASGDLNEAEEIAEPGPMKLHL